MLDVEQVYENKPREPPRSGVADAFPWGRGGGFAECRNNVLGLRRRGEVPAVEPCGTLVRREIPVARSLCDQNADPATFDFDDKAIRPLLARHGVS